MREILFRGKRKDNGIWITGAYHPADGRHFIFPLPIIPPMIKVVPETVGQFTGLRDKNGNRIFEWDIIRGEGIAGEEIIEPVLCAGYEWLPFDYVVPFSVEVIGNIHDNPELLKEGEQR